MERIRQEKPDYTAVKRKRVAKGAEIITQTPLTKNKEKEQLEKAKKKIDKKSQKPKAKSKIKSAVNSDAIPSVLQSSTYNIGDKRSNADNKEEYLIDTEFDNIHLYATEHEEEEKGARMDIVNEQTRHIRRMVVTSAVIENHSSPKVCRKFRLIENQKNIVKNLKGHQKIKSSTETKNERILDLRQK